MVLPQVPSWRSAAWRAGNGGGFSGPGGVPDEISGAHLGLPLALRAPLRPLVPPGLGGDLRFGAVAPQSWGCRRASEAVVCGCGAVHFTLRRAHLCRGPVGGQTYSAQIEPIAQAVRHQGH